MITVNGDEKIHLENTQLYLFNNCKEKCTFSTRPRVLRDQISQEILVGIVSFLCLSKIYLSSFKWSKLHSKNQDKTVFIRSWIFHILAILLRTSQVNNVWVLKVLWPGKPAILVWQRNYHVQTVSFTKSYWTILRSLEAFLFQMNRDNSGNSIDLILVGKCPVCYQITEKK